MQQRHSSMNNSGGQTRLMHEYGHGLPYDHKPGVRAGLPANMVCVDEAMLMRSSDAKASESTCDEFTEIYFKNFINPEDGLRRVHVCSYNHGNRGHTDIL